MIFREAIALKPSEPAAFADLRNEIRAGIADARGYVSEKAAGFRAHASVAYSNGTLRTRGLRRALDDVDAENPVSTFSEASLICMHREDRMYEWETQRSVPLHFAPTSHCT